MNFGAPHWLWCLLILPLVAALFLRAESQSTARLRQFASARLLAQLGASVSHTRRRLRFALLLLGIALALVALAQPRWGYTFEEVKRKGLDLIIAIDTSRSMLANDVAPSRLQRTKLAVQDLIAELRGDRVGLIAFAGRAFLQAPLTIDYDAALEALGDIDTNTIPEGGTNISEAITLAVSTFGKSAIGNRALIIFTDGEDLAGDAAKLAKEAGTNSGVRIFTVGVGTAEGSLIPLPQTAEGTTFVKDQSGQVVKSRLDEKRLREIAESTGGIFRPLGDGTSTVQELYREGLGKMQAAEIDARTSQRPIERYQWPLAGALVALAASFLLNDRKRRVATSRRVSTRSAATVAAALLFLTTLSSQAAAPGLDEYRSDRYAEAYERFQQTLKDNPNARATDKIQFDAGAAAYKMKDYAKALQAFSQALLSPDPQLQSRSHYNLGNTLYQRGEGQKKDDEKLKEWTNALQHYDQSLKIDPENKETKENREFVQKKIDDLKKKQEQQPSPTPTPSPSPSPKDKKKDQKKSDDKDKDQKDKQDQQQKNDEQQKPNDSQKDKSGQQDSKPNESPTPSPSPSPNEQSKDQPGSSPSPSPSPSASPQGGSSPSPSPSAGNSPSPSPKDNQGASPSPSPSEKNEPQDKGENDSPSPAPSSSPNESSSPPPTGEVKGNSGEQPSPSPSPGEEMAEAEEVPEGQMSEEQAERLLRSMRDEEQRVQLDERRAVRRVYKDW